MSRGDAVVAVEDDVDEGLDVVDGLVLGGALSACATMLDASVSCSKNAPCFQMQFN